MLYVTPADLEVETGETFTGDAEQRVQRWLEQAQALIETAVTDLPARITAGTLAQDTVEQVITEMVVGKLRNPTGLRSSTETTGPYTRSGTFADGAASGRIELTRRHRKMLGVGGAFTVNAAPNAAPPATTVPLAGTAEWPAWWV